MTKDETNVRLIYVSRLDENVKCNKFINIPDDLLDFIHKEDGTMSGIVENLYPDQDYQIEISIKTIKP